MPIPRAFLLGLLLMPPPSNTSFLTATPIDLAAVSLPYATSQLVDDGAVVYDVYVKITVPTDVAMVSVLGYGDLATYFPVVTVWTGPAVSPTQYIGSPSVLIAASDVPIQFPVAPGIVEYWLKFAKNTNATTKPTTLHLRFHVVGNTRAVPIGAIAINDDTSGLPLAILSPVDGSILRFIQPFPAGEGGDVLANGRVLVEDVDLSGVVLYAADYRTVLASIATTRSQPIRATPNGDAFYAAYRGAGATSASVHRVDADGQIGATTWTLTGAANVTGISVSPDETILYYVGAGGSSANAVKRWDLAQNLALSDLVTAVANQIVGGLGDNVLVLADGTVLVSWHRTTDSARFVNRYSVAGAILNTYSFGTTTIDRLFSAANPTHFMVWLQPDGVNDTVTEIDAATGTVVNSVTNLPEFELGHYTGADSATPPYFGHSNSCPAWIVRRALTASGDVACVTAPPTLGCWGAHVAPSIGSVNLTPVVPSAACWGADDRPSASCVDAFTSPPAAACWAAHDPDATTVSLFPDHEDRP